MLSLLYLTPRLWLTGYDQEPNYCRYSQFNDGLYFGDVWYILAGTKASKVTGFSILDNKLVVHKDKAEKGCNAYIYNSKIDEDGDAQFLTVNILQGEGAIGCFDSLGNEPLFLTNRGIYALAQSDATSERYTQNRSYYINGQITKSENLKEAVNCVYKQFYVFAVDCKMYLLDSEQKTRENNQPFSEFQYECYVWDNIPANCVWVYNEKLYFGTKDGKVCVFSTGKTSGDYMDIDKPVTAYWTTPLMFLDTFSRYKTVAGVWVVCQPYSRSGADVFYATDKEYEKLAKSFNIDMFDWNDIDFNRFTFNTLDRPSVQFSKRKAKKVKLFQVKIQNDKAEPFGLSALQLEYRIGGKIK